MRQYLNLRNHLSPNQPPTKVANLDYRRPIAINGASKYRQDNLAAK
jgi:hypothetical protein